MFYCCKKLKRLDLSNFNFAKTTDVSSFVGSCSALEFLDIRTLTFDKITSYRSMLAGIPTSCLIIVNSETERDFILANVRSGMTNIKTVAEYEAAE
jgi:surface protein